jgi:multicomponent Na+:H+ antiporter subunit B
VIGEYRGQVVRVTSVLMAPVIMLFGLYVIAHGHYGPGGGFAGGIIVGVGIILLRITVSAEHTQRWFPASGGPVAASIGVLLFLVTGAASLVVGGEFLDYSAVQVPGLDDADMRYLGILVVEIGVGLAVTGVMLTLFDSLIGGDGDS